MIRRVDLDQQGNVDECTAGFADERKQEFLRQRRDLCRTHPGAGEGRKRGSLSRGRA